jgi:hypothetical protein
MATMIIILQEVLGRHRPCEGQQRVAQERLRPGRARRHRPWEGQVAAESRLPGHGRPSPQVGHRVCHKAADDRELAVAGHDVGDRPGRG